MAHFYGEVRGGRGEATRCGTKKSGLRSRAAGWGLGATVSMYHSEDEEMDHVSIVIDEGNGNHSGRSVSLSLSERELENIVKNSDPTYALGRLLITRSNTYRRGGDQPCENGANNS